MIYTSLHCLIDQSHCYLLWPPLLHLHTTTVLLAKMKEEEEEKKNECNNKMKKGFDTIFKWSSMYSALRFGQGEVLIQT